MVTIRAGRILNIFQGIEPLVRLGSRTFRVAVTPGVGQGRPATDVGSALGLRLEVRVRVRDREAGP